jgi:hypothetical protein
MGGSTGGRLPESDIRRLEENVKRRLSESESDSSPHVFISFANEDIGEINLLRGQAANEKTDLQFDDFSVKEPYDSTNAEYIKRQIRERIKRSSVIVVYLSDDGAKSKWVNWKIEEGLRQGKGVIGVHKSGAIPNHVPEAFGKNGCKIVEWGHDELKAAIEAARKNRLP